LTPNSLSRSQCYSKANVSKLCILETKFLKSFLLLKSLISSLYCIGALRLTSSAVRQLSVCWNNAFRKIFHFRRFESVRMFQVEFGTVDFQHLYDLHRCEFLKSFGDKCQYWSQIFYMLELQYHVCDELVDKYVVRTGFN